MEKIARILLNATTDGALLIDTKGTVIDLNETMAKKFNKNRDELINRCVFDFLPPEIARNRRNKTRQVVRSGRPIRFEEKGGKDRWFDSSLCPILDKQGKVSRIAVFAHDITRHRKAEEALRKNEKRFRDIEKNALEWIWEIDRNGKYIYTSPVVEKILGYKPQEILKRHFYDLFHPEEREELKKTAFEMFARRQPFRKFINKNVHKSGEVVWLSTSGVPVFDGKRKFAGYRGADIDITERRKAEEALRKSEENIREFSRKILSIREEEKKRLAGNLHNEIGSMIVASGSCLSIAEKEIRDNNLDGALMGIRQCRKRLRKAAENLKGIAVDLRPASLDVIGLTSALREYFSDITKETRTGIEFSADINEREIGGDAATVLYRAAQEALTNTIKHARARKAKIRLYTRGSDIRLNMRDDGRGFDTGRTLRETKGLGILGMRESVESLDGRFVIKSSPEKGTEISVRLPNTKRHKS